MKFAWRWKAIRNSGIDKKLIRSFVKTKEKMIRWHLKTVRILIGSLIVYCVQKVLFFYRNHKIPAKF